MVGQQVSDFMYKQYLSVKPDQLISEVTHALLANEQIGAPVVDHDNQLIGWVSERDCLAQMLHAGYYCEHTALACDIMRADVLTVNDDMAILDLAKQMLDDKPKSYPVLHEGKLVGVIDRKAVLKMLDSQRQQCFKPV